MKREKILEFSTLFQRYIGLQDFLKEHPTAEVKSKGHSKKCFWVQLTFDVPKPINFSPTQMDTAFFDSDEQLKSFINDVLMKKSHYKILNQYSFQDEQNKTTYALEYACD